MKLSVVGYDGFVDSFEPNEPGLFNIDIAISVYTNNDPEEKDVCIELSILDTNSNKSKLNANDETIKIISAGLTFEDAAALGAFLLESAKNGIKSRGN